MSRSQANALEASLNDQDPGVLGATFPLFDELTKKVHLPDIFAWIVEIWALVQTLTMSLWLRNEMVWTDGSLTTDVIFYLTTFRPRTPSYDDIMICVIIVIAIVALILVLVIFQAAYFARYRKFLEITLYPTRIFMELLPNVVLGPLAMTTGLILSEVGMGTADSVYYVFAILLPLLYLFNAVVFFVTSEFLNQSAYLSKNPFSSFLPRNHVMLFIQNSLLGFAHVFFRLFPRWINIVLIVLHLLGTARLFLGFLHVSFVRLAAAICLMAFSATECIMDLVSLVLYITDLEMIPELLLGLAGGVLLLSFIVLPLYTERKLKRMRRELAYNEEINICDAEHGTVPQTAEGDIQPRLQALGLRSEQTAFAYLLCGLTYGCDMFVDFSLMRYILALHQSPAVLTLCLRIMIFFPSEYHQTSLILHELRRFRDLPARSVFLMGQIEKIRVVRQSSTSSLANSKYKEMMLTIAETEKMTTAVWLAPAFHYPEFRTIMTQVSAVDARCQEIVNDFPNSVQHAEAYVHFLIECATDFSHAIRQRHKIDQMETGQSFAIDYCFKSMIRMYPLYLKKGILDVKGSFLRRERNKMGSQKSSSLKMGQISNSSTGEMDAAVEENIAKGLITQARTRLALQSALTGKSANAMKPLVIYNAYMTVVSVALCFVLFFALAGYFSLRPMIIDRGNAINAFRLALDAAAFTILLDWGNVTAAVDLEEIKRFIGTENAQPMYLDRSEFWPTQGRKLLVDARDQWKIFASAIADLALDPNYEVLSRYPLMFEKAQDFVQCHHAMRNQLRATNVKSIFSAMWLSGGLTVGKRPIEGVWNESDDFCSLFASIPIVTPGFNTLRVSDKDEATDTTARDSDTLNLMMIIVVTAYAALGFLPFPILAAILLREMRAICRMFVAMEPQYKRDAAAQIHRATHEKKDSPTESTGQDFDWRLTGLFFMIMVLFAGLLVITVYVFQTALKTNTDFQNINLWSFYSSIQRPRAIEMLLHIFNAVFLTNETLFAIQNTTSPAIESDRMNVLADDMDLSITLFLGGDAAAPSIIGVNDAIDDFLLKESCTVEHAAGQGVDFHDMYACSTLSHQIQIYTEFLRSVVSRIHDFTGIVNDTMILHAYHMVMRHTMTSMNTVNDELSILTGLTADEFKQTATILFVCGIVLSLLAALLVFIYIATVDNAFQGAMLILRRCSPAGVVANQSLLNYLLHQDEEAHKAMSTSRAIIHNARDAIICVSPNGIIDSVNLSVTQMLGYIPEQLLGQNIRIIVSEKASAEVLKRLDMMVRRECPRQFKETYPLINDADEEVMCSVDIMGMTGGDGQKIETFVVIIKDITQLIEQQAESEDAKAKSEKLLYEILPRDIVNRINQGEKDITFVVPSATLMFIDIQKFSAYAADLTPQEIMGNLSLIFGAFDGLLPRYPLITKIKLIGDVYMCGAGLFTPDEEPKSHAVQMVRFAIDVLGALEEVNVKLSASLCVRIGVNTGGPIIAGVLGTDKPVFDIIGDPINIAARLQSTCIPNRVQISEDTYGLLKDMDFTIEPRGEIFLKGKGKRPAFLISPQINLAFAPAIMSELLSGRRDRGPSGRLPMKF
jgi:PAS domain S-box-containing protein